MIWKTLSAIGTYLIIIGVGLAVTNAVNPYVAGCCILTGIGFICSVIGYYIGEKSILAKLYLAILYLLVYPIVLVAIFYYAFESAAIFWLRLYLAIKGEHHGQKKLYQDRFYRRNRGYDREAR